MFNFIPILHRLAIFERCSFTISSFNISYFKTSIMKDIESLTLIKLDLACIIVTMAIAETMMNNSVKKMYTWPAGSLWWRVSDGISGSVLTLFFLLSTTLNPIVFYHYWKLPSTLPNILYRILALADFITNLVRPLKMASLHFSPTHYPTPIVIQDLNILSMVSTVVVRMSVTVSFAAVALLALTRAIKIQWPFFHIRKMFVFLWLSLVAVFELVVLVLEMIIEKKYMRRVLCLAAVVSLKEVPDEESGGRMQATLLARIAMHPMYVHAVIATIVSNWGVVALARTIQQSTVNKNSGVENPSIRETAFHKIRTKFKGCGAIVVINLTSMMTVISLLAYIYKVKRRVFADGRIGFCHSTYVVNFFLPSLIAATNPLILMKFNLELRKRAMFWKKSSRSQPNRKIMPIS